MRVGAARAVAARWVAEHAAGIPGFAGAFLSGSAAWMGVDAELPGTSDVDLMVVVAGPDAPPKLGKVRYGGVLVEVTYLPAGRLGSSRAVLASYHLAGSLRAGAILADPGGRLAELHAAVARDFARRRWVRARCDHAERRIVEGLDGLDPAGPLPDQVTAWLFATGVTTHVLLTAGLRNPTVRQRYLAARSLLRDYGRPDFHEELLRLLGCERLPPERVAEHLAAMARLFDAAAAVARTPFPFSADITPAARPVAVDGGRELIERGDHREAVFWIVATSARCLKILAADAPAATGTGFHQGFAALLADLGIAAPADLRGRARAVRHFLPRLREVKEAILAANPDLED